MANTLIAPADLERLANMIVEGLAKLPRTLTKHHLAEKIGISVSTIERLMAEKKIPFIKANRRVMFDVEAVLKALSKNSESES